MARFRFRAQAALDLRRREHEERQRLLAIAEAERQRASDGLIEREQALADARRSADHAAGLRGSATDALWYRIWILRLDRDRAAMAAALQKREAAVAEASAACLQARVKREALERFRDKAYAEFVAAEAAEERKTIDELATRRFNARRDLTEGAEP